MYLLPCPSCDASLSVSPSQAGDAIPCPSCEQIVQIPKLGELRQLPEAESPRSPASRSAAQNERGIVQRISFVVLGLIGTASLLIAGFSTVRWAYIKVEKTTEGHVQKYQEAYESATAADLLREYEQMDQFGLDIAMPHDYKAIETKKERWGRIAMISGAIGVIGLGLGIGLLAIGKPQQSDS